MELEINARVSNRHVHLNKETYDLLFRYEISKYKELNQVGEFASNEKVSIINGDKCIENVRVVGPLRPYNQIEISSSDARFLGINPPVRRSGDLDDSLEVTLKTVENEVKVKGVIIANRHVHMNKEDAVRYNVKDKQIVKIRIDGYKSGLIDAEIKVTDNGYLELHLDTDDANAFLLKDNDKVTMII